MTSDSLTVFGSMVAVSDEDMPELSIEQLQPMLQDEETQLRDAHFRKIQLWRKYGEVLHNAKAKVGRKNFLAWIEDRAAVYEQSRGAEGFEWMSEKTTDNYINLHILYMEHSEIYQQYRIWPDYILYQVASFYLNGKDPETVPAIAAKSGARKTLDSFPALVDMVDRGEMSHATAMKLVSECQTELNEVIVNTVRFWGVRGLAEFAMLHKVDESILQAIANNEPYNNLFTEAANTEGWVTDEHGNQVPLREMSHREIWQAHCRSRWQGTDGDEGGGSGGGAKSKTLYKGMIKRETAADIARLLNARELLATLENSRQDLFNLKVDQPL